MNTDARIRAFLEAEQRYLEFCCVTAHSRTIQLEQMGVRARLLEAGAGAPVLLVHGGGAMGSLWAPLMAHLADFRLLAVDRPGFGLTEVVDYRGVSLRSHAVQFLTGILDGVGVDQVAIVANSMGALWSLWFAQAHPNRVTRLALLGTPALILNTSAPGPMRLLSVPGLNRLLMALEPPSSKKVRRLWKRLGHDPDRTCPAELVELIVRLQELPGYAVAWRTLLQNALRLGGAAPGVRFDESSLRSVSQEVLYIWGQNDPFGSLEIARRVTEITPRAELQVVGSGHLPWVDDLQACARILQDFLSRGLTGR